MNNPDRKRQEESLTPAQAYFITSMKKFLWFCAGRGCFAPGTEIKMFDGSVKNVEDIKVGDALVGDDMNPRFVMSLTDGYDEMYRVILNDESYYDCNAGHEFVVVDERDGFIKEIALEDALGNEHHYSHIRIVEGRPEKHSFKLLNIGFGKYYGFNLDNNNRFTLSNGIITKNSGKCFAKNTEFLMFDGNTKKVQDIEVGDELMGWDSSPRKVTGLAQGWDNLYEIKSKKWKESHTVNSDHILTFYDSKRKINDLEIKSFIQQSDYKKNSAKIFKKKISSFEFKETGIDPYIAGLWIGDGSRKALEITSEDQIIMDVWDSYFSQFDFLYRRIVNQSEKVKIISYSVGRKLRDKNGWSHNPLWTEIKKLMDSDRNKIISKEFLFNSEEVRLQILAGIIDTDGYLYGNNKFEITTKFNTLADDLIYLCRSLGFYASKSEKKVKIREGDIRTYYRIYISGDTYKIPTKLPRKQAISGNIKGNVSSFTVEKVGFGEYYGFEVEGDGRILLSDFTVTHNTRIGSRWVYKNVLKYPRARGMIAANTYNQLHSATLPPVLAYFREMGLEYRVNKRPPESWLRRSPVELAEYKNVLTTETGAHIFLRSLDNYDYIRGIEFGWAWIDEISSTNKDAWDVIVGCLRDPECEDRMIRVTGTPDGDNWTWREFEKKWSKDPIISKMYDIVFMSSRENPFLPEEFLDMMLASYDRRTALQEIDGRVLIDNESLIYYEWRPKYHMKQIKPYDPNLPLIMCWDFNSSDSSPMSMVLAQQHYYSDGTPFVQVIDEIIIMSGNTPMVCEEFTKRYNRKHNSEIYVYGDRTGTTNKSVGINDYGMIMECLSPYFPKIVMRNVKKNMGEKDRRAAMNSMLLNAKGQVRMFINPKCLELIKDFDELKPDKFGKINKSDLKRSHASDALGYYIAKEFPVVTKKQKGDDDFKINLGLR